MHLSSLLFAETSFKLNARFEAGSLIKFSPVANLLKINLKILVVIIGLVITSIVHCIVEF